MTYDYYRSSMIRNCFCTIVQLWKIVCGNNLMIILKILHSELAHIPPWGTSEDNDTLSEVSCGPDTLLCSLKFKHAIPYDLLIPIGPTLRLMNSSLCMRLMKQPMPNRDLLSQLYSLLIYCFRIKSERTSLFIPRK